MPSKTTSAAAVVNGARQIKLKIKNTNFRCTDHCLQVSGKRRRTCAGRFLVANKDVSRLAAHSCPLMPTSCHHAPKMCGKHARLAGIPDPAGIGEFRKLETRKEKNVWVGGWGALTLRRVALITCDLAVFRPLQSRGLPDGNQSRAPYPAAPIPFANNEL